MAAHFSNQFIGTIPALGSLSQVIDTEAWDVLGLVVYPQSGTIVAGSVQFRVAADNVSGTAPTTLYPLCDNTGARVAFNIGSAARAYGYEQAQTLSPYRYVQIEMTANQHNAVTCVIPVKKS